MILKCSRLFFNLLAALNKRSWQRGCLLFTFTTNWCKRYSHVTEIIGIRDHPEAKFFFLSVTYYPNGRYSVCVWSRWCNRCKTWILHVLWKYCDIWSAQYHRDCNRSTEECKGWSLAMEQLSYIMDPRCYMWILGYSLVSLVHVFSYVIDLQIMLQFTSSVNTLAIN